VHLRNFTLKSGGDQWRRQDLVSGGIGGGAGGGAQPPMTGLGGTMHSGPPTLTAVDRNKAYCFGKFERTFFERG